MSAFLIGFLALWIFLQFNMFSHQRGRINVPLAKQLARNAFIAAFPSVIVGGITYLIF